MPSENNAHKDGKDSFKIFHELMAKKVKEILLVSSPYDAFIMEEDGRLVERIIHEYRGLNLSSPPMITWASSAVDALSMLEEKSFDLVIAMPHLSDMTPHILCGKIKDTCPDIPIYFLAHNPSETQHLLNASYRRFADKVFVWRGNAELLLALIKYSEDLMNVEADTETAKVRVIILVEDSPLYMSSLLSLLYKEIVLQTQAVIDESINEEHRILRMRARPKILIAETYEAAEALYRRFQAYLLCIFSDVRFQKAGVLDDDAGSDFLTMVRKDMPALPLCMMSSDESNIRKASEINAVFLNKNSSSLHADIRFFLVRNLGFGDFVFRSAEGKVIARASSLRTLGSILPSVPEKSIYYHAMRNDFSTWLMARGEIELAYELRDVKATDFKKENQLKAFLVRVITAKLIERQEGRVADFIQDGYDPYAGFIKIGRGSLGGKARGLAFMNNRLRENKAFHDAHSNIRIVVPKTTVISTEGFDAFIEENQLKNVKIQGRDDKEIEAFFLKCRFPGWLEKDLEQILEKITYPLAVRSSSLLEDGYDRPFAGAYNTYMLPNNHSDIQVRLAHLVAAVKLVYASVFLKLPQSFAKSSLVRIEEEKMAVMIQKLAGSIYGDYFYPAVSGVAQSYNYYPIDYMKPEEGIAFISAGLGKSVVEGYTSIRFSPKYPEFLPQFSSVDAILKNSQKYLFALNMKNFPHTLTSSQDLALTRLDVEDEVNEGPVRMFSSTYYPEDHRIRDSLHSSGYPVLTFARILKQSYLRLPEIIMALMEMGRVGMGCPVEIEFAVDLDSDKEKMPEFQLLQVRPLTVTSEDHDIEITAADREHAFCYTGWTMGRSQVSAFRDVLFVKPDPFDPLKTLDIARDIRACNTVLEKSHDDYILIGPGRWGSSDRFLGIPVTWADISGARCIVETWSDRLNADPSQGTHFFHNITSLGITYMTVENKQPGFIDWQWLQSMPVFNETTFIRHVRLNMPVTMKVDGRSMCGAIIKNTSDGGHV